VRTVVFSDLHLGAGSGGDLLRRDSFREILMDALAGADRVVLLGDVLELRDRPVGDVVRIATPFFADLAETAGEAQVVVVPGNHDHHLVEPWLEQRMLDGAAPLELEQRAAPDGALAALAHAGGLDVEIAYPGVWLGDRIYATHGHYLDRHLTIPTFERLGVGAVERLLGMHTTGPDPLDPPGADEPPGPDQYERAQGPIYALLFALAQGTEANRVGAGNPTLRLWRSVARGSSRSTKTRNWLLGSVAVPGAVGIANRLGLGPVQADISASAITAAGLVAIGDVVERLDIGAETVLFGHTHRRGPIAGDGEWALPSGGRLLNTGSWVHSPTLLRSTAARSPYWPGTIAVLEDDGEPELHHLLDDMSREDLARDAGASPPGPDLA
jgi:UDP-2,3-diacylglucosamine pyrophosphatase LpxH